MIATTPAGWALVLAISISAGLGAALTLQFVLATCGFYGSSPRQYWEEDRKFYVAVMIAGPVFLAIAYLLTFLAC